MLRHGSGDSKFSAPGAPWRVGKEQVVHELVGLVASGVSDLHEGATLVDVPHDEHAVGQVFWGRGWWRTTGRRRRVFQEAGEASWRRIGIVFEVAHDSSPCQRKRLAQVMQRSPYFGWRLMR